MKACLKIEDLTLEQKIGMVLTVRTLDFSEEDTEFVFDLIKNHAIGTVQINPDSANFEKHMKRVRETADYPILIGCDMERGNPRGGYLTPGNMALGALHSAEDVYNFAYITAKQAKEAGYNMIWSPVIDCADHDRPCTVCRSFGDTGEQAAEYGIAYMKAFADCGIIGSAKHYPSVQDGMMDSHMAEEQSNVTLEELLENNLYPYRKMIEVLGDDMTGIMVGHHRCPKIDPDYPATLSGKLLSILREQGFRGLLITDSFAMVGLIQNFGDDKILGLAMNAGNDLILPNYRISFRRSYEYLLQNFREGMFSEERLNEAVLRVLEAQKRTLQPVREHLLPDSEMNILRKISENCICEFRDPEISSALSREKKHLFVILKENQYPEEHRAAESMEIFFTVWWDPYHIQERLLAEYPGSSCCFVCEYPSRRQVETICVESTKCDDVIYLTFCDGQCYQGTDGLTERLRVLMKATEIKNAALLHCGNPYAAAKTVHFPRTIIGFPHPLCIDAALDVLSGRKKAEGELPLKNLLPAFTGERA